MDSNDLTGIFIHMLNAGYQAGMAVLIIIIARAFLKWLRAPEKYICILWLIPFIRLAVPVWPQSIFSLLPKETEPVPAEIGLMEQPVIYTNSQWFNQLVSGSLPAATPEASVNPMQIWLFVFAVIWIAGVIVFYLYGIASVIILKRRLRAGICACDNIYLADGISTAFVMGICRPRIYLPSNIAEDIKAYVVCHEKQHIKRKDHIIKIAVFIITCFYWLHPLIWVGYFLINRDIEFACDEAVVRSKPQSYRQKYAEALLRLSVGAKKFVTMPLAFSERSPKRRIKHIISYRKPLAVAGGIGAVFIILLAVGLLTDPVAGAFVEAEDNASAEAAPKEQQTEVMPEEQQAETVPEAKAPVIDLAAPVGADGVRLYYADENNIIFGGYFGLIVYSKAEQAVVRGLDLQAIGCGATQGDDYCEIFVSVDGEAVYLHPMSSEEMYIYSVPENALEKAAYTLDNIQLYTGMEESGHSVSYESQAGEAYCFISYSDTIGSISWCENNDVYGVYHRFFPPEGYENAICFEPEDIYDLVKIEMYIEGEMHAMEEPEALKWVETKFSQAERMKDYSKCPFYDPMYLTRADGAIGIIYPATDSCDLFLTAEGCYDYGKEDNSEFWGLFENWVERLR